MSNVKNTKKMKKLTANQFENVVKVLNKQLKGFTTLFGQRYGYNQNECFFSKTNFDSEQKRMLYKTTGKITNSRNGKSLLSLEIWDRLDFGYSEFFSAHTLNVQKLITNYSNGLDAMNEALQTLKSNEA